MKLAQAVNEQSSTSGWRSTARAWLDGSRGPALGVVIIAAWLLVGTFAFRYLKGPPDSIENAFYLSTVTFLTIGYGDMSPSTMGAKLFCVAFIIFSLVVQTVVGGYVLSRVADMNSEGAPAQSSTEAGADAYFKLRPKFVALAKSFALLLLFVLGLTLWMALSEDRSFVDSLYFAVVTLTTVGYGDVVPHANRGWFAVYMLCGVLVFGFLVGQSIGIALDVTKIQKMQRFFRDGLTLEMLEKMDHSKDGKVHRYEFFMFMLQELGIASPDQITKILLVFDTLDKEADGVLDINDVLRYQQLSQRGQPQGGLVAEPHLRNNPAASHLFDEDACYQGGPCYFQA